MSYLRPKDLTTALEALAESPWRIAAGCTDLFPATEAKTLPGPILDITAIDALRGITRTAEGWRLGATTTWTDVLHANLPPAFAALQAAAREVGALQVQNRGTLAGNLCNASPAADGVPPLLALDAEVELASAKGHRRMALCDFLTGVRQTQKRPDEMMVALHVPAKAALGDSAFLKLGARSYLVISIAMCAVRCHTTENRITDIALAVGACSPVATRLTAIETELTGNPLNDHDIDTAITDAAVAEALSPIADVRADAAYRATAAAELLRRALSSLGSQRRAA